ncbi:MAG: hypothetical protein K6C08_04780 [Oscillospiraceae bacterium]|nr:hypothetical protein [Oscillospiraceae bacterium]
MKIFDALGKMAKELRPGKKTEPEKKLYVCGRCGEKFLNTRIDSCPFCGRLYADKICDRDSGECAGGERIIRLATAKEIMAYRIRRNTREKKKEVLMVVVKKEDDITEQW